MHIICYAICGQKAAVRAPDVRRATEAGRGFEIKGEECGIQTTPMRIEKGSTIWVTCDLFPLDNLC